MVCSVYGDFHSPDLLEVYPAGALAGQTIEMKIEGDSLDGIENLKFSHPGITAEKRYHPKVKNWDEPRPVAKSFKISVPENIKPGFYDVRAVGYYGMSSPCLFYVAEKGAGNEIDSEKNKVKNNSIEHALSLSLEETANGKVEKERADYYKVSLEKGQRVLMHCWASRLGSKLDAVLSVYDSEGNKINGNNDYIERDPMLDFTAPKEGFYYVSVSDQTWSGTKGYVYRLKVSEQPYIETIFPAVSQKGTLNEHTIYGRLLPGGTKLKTSSSRGLEFLKVKIQAPKITEAVALNGHSPLKGLYDGFYYKVKNSNSFRIRLSSHTVLKESEKEDMKVSLPIDIAGSFDSEEDVDQVVFDAKEGDRININLFCERQATKSDPFMLIERVVLEEGKEVKTEDILELDDLRQVKTQGMYDVHSYDIRKEFLIKKTGTYRIVMGDNFSKYGPLHNYSLHIGKEDLDFKLLAFVEQFHFEGDRRTRVYPGALQLRPKSILPIRIRAFRNGGDLYPIDLTVKGLPEGVKVHKANIFPGEEEAYIVLEANESLKPWRGMIQVIGKMTDGKRTVEHEALGATLNWSGYEIRYGYTQRLNARRTHEIPLALLADEPAMPIALGQKDVDKVWEFKKNKSEKIPLVSSRTGDLKGAITVMEFGAASKLNFPFRIFLNDKKDLTLNISYKPNSKNLHLLGDGSFIIRGWSDIMYQTNKTGLEQSNKMKSKIDLKLKEVKDSKVTLDNALKKESTRIAELKKDTTKKDELKALEEKVAKQKTEIEAVKKNIKELEVIHKEIVTENKYYNKRAVEKKFRAGFYSLPVRYRIIDEEKKVVSK